MGCFASLNWTAYFCWLVFPWGLAGETKKALPEVRERCKQAQYTLGEAPGQKSKRPNTTGTRNNGRYFMLLSGFVKLFLQIPVICSAASL